MSGARFTIRNLSKRFGGLVAVNDFSLEAVPGGITGIIGPNGAGKTTVFNLISGFYKPDAGRVFLDGSELTGRSPDAIAAAGVGRTFQNIRLFQGMTVLDNVRTALHQQAQYNLFQVVLGLPPVGREERQVTRAATEALELVGLARSLRAPGTSLPYGLQRRLEIARALARKPRILLLDEPAAGLNPGEVAGLTRLIRSINEKLSLTILVIEHHMDLVASLCQSVTVINFGQVIASGTLAEVQKNSVVLEAYLGKGAHRA
ncbi:MAG: ABC transporter ATP-binding protein [Firmicutes bacterium]|nr:ABC transporter ATP-binding protein [Bacillota bacterium]